MQIRKHVVGKGFHVEAVVFVRKGTRLDSSKVNLSPFSAAEGGCVQSVSEVGISEGDIVHIVHKLGRGS